jgi:hypothetical protein
MRVGGSFAAILLVLTVCAGCCMGIDRDDLYLAASSAPTDITGTGSDNQAVKDALAALMDQRVYDTGMYMQWACVKANNSRLQNGQVFTQIAAEPTQISGTGSGDGVYYTIAAPLAPGQLTVKFVYNSAQGLIYEIRTKGSPETSPSSVMADCTLSGTLAGQAVNLTFKQEIRAKKNGYLGGGFW